MKKTILIFQLLLLSLLLASSIEVSAAQKRVNVRHYPTGVDRPRTRTEPVMCFADKDAGIVEFRFAGNLGELRITIADYNGAIVDEISLDTAIENFTILNMPDPDAIYTLAIEGEQYFGEGLIE
jgi:hypothetical protein